MPSRFGITEELMIKAIGTDFGGIVKCCGFASDHAATFSWLPSTSSPSLNSAPALTNATS